VAGQAGVTPRGAKRLRLGSPATVLVLGGLLVVLAVAAVPLARLAHLSLNASSGSSPVWAAPFIVVGLLLAWRKPGNPLGWIILSASVFFMLSGDASYYTVADYRLHHGGLPLGWLALLAQPGWAPTIVLLGLTFLLFPDGRPPSARWRWVLWAYAGIGLLWIAGTVVITVGAIIGHHTQVDSGGNLLLLSGINPASGWWNVLQIVFFPLLALCWLASLAGQMASWRRSSGERRQQLKWLMTGSAGVLVGIGISLTTSGGSPILSVIALAGLFAFPVCIGVAVLKYRLFDIDRIISRTLAYAIITGLLIGVYAGVVLLATRVLPFSGPVAVAVATLAAAALFNPLRRRVQKLVDRRFNRARYDADQIIAAFAARLQDAVDLDAVRADLASSVRQALEPAHISMWVKTGERL
jgi:hypothetical protein